MSSAIYMTFDPPISRQDWLAFCREHGVGYSPQTMGWNVFYYNGFGGVQISFGEDGSKTLRDDEPFEVERLAIPIPGYKAPKLSLDCRPPKQATRMTVSTFFMGGIITDKDGKRCNKKLETVSEIADKIKARFCPKKVRYDPELDPERQ